MLSSTVCSPFSDAYLQKLIYGYYANAITQRAGKYVRRRAYFTLEKTTVCVSRGVVERT
jgi:hypothetical protein